MGNFVNAFNLKSDLWLQPSLLLTHRVKGDMIFSALVRLAALIVLLMLGGIIVSLIISSWPSIQKFGFSFLWTKDWDAPNDIYGALVPIYGTLVTSLIAADCRSGEFRHCAVPD
jgi:ABC-type phosphate transport system permease subunit